MRQIDVKNALTWPFLGNYLYEKSIKIFIDMPCILTTCVCLNNHCMNSNKHLHVLALIAFINFFILDFVVAKLTHHYSFTTPQQSLWFSLFMCLMFLQPEIITFEMAFSLIFVIFFCYKFLFYC